MIGKYFVIICKHLVPTLGSVLVSVLLVLLALPMKADHTVAGASVVPPANPTSFTVDAAWIKSAAQKTQGADGCNEASFAQPVGSPVGAGSGPASVAVSDFNLDGKPDLTVANEFSNNVTILLGNGSGGFTEPAGSPIGAGSNPFSVVAGDFNLDGKADLAIANLFSDNLTILLGDGSGGFSQAAGSPVSAGSGPASVAAGDFNLDGRPDLAVANIFSNDVTILSGDGSGGFSQSTGSPFGAGALPISVAIEDFNLDGKPDLSVANSGSNNVTVLLGNGSGGFTQPASSPVAVGTRPFSLAAGDFNLDGKSDVAVANNESHNVTVLLGDGSGGFAQAAGSPVGAGVNPRSIAVGDFNLGGQLDLAVANQGSNNVTILFGNGGGGFTEPAGSPLGAGAFPFSVAVGDFNLDRKPDLSVANIDSGDVTIQLNNCDAFPCSGIGFTQAGGSPIGAGNQPASVEMADFNLDGKLDLAVANLSSSDVTILLGNGMGGFSQPAGSPVGAGLGPRSVAVGDFNLDGKPDLAVANEVAPPGTVTILLGNGLGSFSQPAGSPVATGSGSGSVAVGDFDLDGKPDLAVANFGSNDVTILLGNGIGSFSQPAGSPIGAGTNPRSVTVGDFNLDGKPDLAVVNINSDNVTILLGDATGGFAQPAGSPVAVGTFPSSVAANDFNLDGKPDLAVGIFGSNNVTVLLGNGMGSFSQPAGSPVGTGSGPVSVEVGDFNLDGKPDVAVANVGGGITILLGNGVGGFTQPAGSPVAAGNEPFSTTIGDFNLDGKPDMAVANFGSNTVSILLNVCTAAAPCTDIACPANITAVTANAADPCSVVNFAPPASDDCPGAAIVCNPASGSCFPVGTTTVACMATNASGATVTCTFTVTVFNGRLQDDSQGCNNSVLFNTIRGDYRWCCHGTIFTGRAKVTRLGNTSTLQHNAADRRVLIKLAAGNSPPSGSASLQSPPGTIRCVITDRNTRNDTCICGGIVVRPTG